MRGTFSNMNKSEYSSAIKKLFDLAQEISLVEDESFITEGQRATFLALKALFPEGFELLTHVRDVRIKIEDFKKAHNLRKIKPIDCQTIIDSSYDELTGVLS